MSTDLKNLPVLVTGGGSGIGRSAAIRFAQAGSKVFLVGRTESKLYAVKQEIKDLYPEVEVDFFAADIKVKDQLSSAVDTAVSRFGGLSVVVANGTYMYFSRWG
jgi:NAD(P)-dependent dehydrogenase (short-subunit alcohol dehydrogenase family)